MTHDPNEPAPLTSPSPSEAAEASRPRTPTDPRPRAAPRSSSTTKLLLGVTLLGGLVFVGSIGAVAWLVSQEDAGEVHEGSFLALELKGKVPTAPPPPSIFDEPGDSKPTGTELAAALRHAATDDRIEGLYLVFDNPAMGWGTAKEIRDGIVALRDAGKPCVAYSEIWTTGTWYVGSACDHVVMPPSGISLVYGLDARTTYYAGTFEKLGVESQMLHVGDFKSAVEVYERSGPSEAAAEAMNYLLDGLWGEVISDAAASRGWTPEEMQARVDRPTLSPQRTLDAGMVDLLAYPDVFVDLVPEAGAEDWRAQVEAAMEEAGTSSSEEDDDEDDDRFTSAKEYVKGLRSEWRDADDQIAVIHASGAIMSGDDEGGIFGSVGLTDRGFRRWIRAAADDDAVKAIVLRVDSPGGSGLASDMMWREIRKVQADGTPVVVSMGNYAASGGYYISAPADWVVAQPTTLTGSIGVFGGKFNLAGTYEKMGLTQHSYKRGEQADLFASTIGFSEGARESYQGFLDDFYGLFLDRVAEGRAMDRDAVHLVAQGRVWTGSQALERGLVDEVGGLDVALAKAAELAEVEEYGVSTFPKQKTFFEMLADDLERSASAPTVTVQLPVAEEALNELLILDRILQDGVAAMLPGNLTIE